MSNDGTRAESKIYIYIFFVHTVTSVAVASFSTESVQQTQICPNCQSGREAQRYWEKFFLLFFRLCQKNRYFRLFSSAFGRSLKSQIVRALLNCTQNCRFCKSLDSVWTWKTLSANNDIVTSIHACTVSFFVMNIQLQQQWCTNGYIHGLFILGIPIYILC